MPEKAPPVETTEVVVADPESPSIGEIETAVPSFVARESTYMEAIEFGKVAAMSQFWPQVHDAAKAAMVCAMGAALGVAFPIALSKIHVLSKDGKFTFIIEGSLLGKMIRERPGIEYKVLKSSDEEAEIEFLEHGEAIGPNILWDQKKAVRAGLWGKKGPWQTYPDAMLRWRALAEGTRIYFPEVIGGGAVYVQEEMDDGGNLTEALKGPAPKTVLADAEAEELREAIEAEWEKLREINPQRMSRDRMRSGMAKFGHSHVELRQCLAQMVENVDYERELQEAIAELREKADEKVAKEVVARAERRGSPAEKVDVLRKALEEFAARMPESEEGSDDGE